MSLVSLHEITIAFGGPPLLENVSLDIHKNERICFLGRNGAGKSTFMKILSGETQADSGRIIAAPGIKIAYLPQEIPEGALGRIFDIVAAGISRSSITHDDHETWHIDNAVERVLDQMHLNGEDDYTALSGGMRRRVFLARALVAQPDLLLLDEPTNHLDIESITQLEKFILDSKLTLLFVTHDRRLLRRIATRIIGLDRGRLVDWSCDYETFLVRKKSVLDAEEKEWERFDKKLAQEEVWIRKGIQARRTRNEGRVRALKRMRDLRRKRRERSGNVSLTIGAATQSGERVLKAINVAFSYGDKTIINSLEIEITRGDKIGVIGPNGCGKTTLLNLLLGKIAPMTGTIKFGVNPMPAYFDQLREALDPDKTVWENVAPGGDFVFVNGQSKHIVAYLQDFLFTTDRIHSPVKQLSGGERNRLMLAKLFTQPANMLVFDEPTNDLDTETLELLEELLLQYKGTILVVSHDREFLNNIVTSTLAYEGEGFFKEYVGGFDDWEAQKSAHAAIVKQSVAPAEPVVKTKPRRTDPGKLSYKETRELETLPKLIEDRENELDEFHRQLADPSFFTKAGFVAQAKERIAAIEREVSQAYARWQELDGK